MRRTLARLRQRFLGPCLDYAELTAIVIGLGNPGRRNAATRHNLGWRVVERCAAGARLDFQPGRGDFFATRWRRPEGDALLVLPTTFMNRSGEAGRQLLGLSGLTPARCLVVADDLDLPLGRLRLRAQGGPGGHGGLVSLAAAWGEAAFPRLRLGIGRPPAPPAGEAGDAVTHVLGPFAPEEAAQVAAVVDAGAEAVDCFLAEGLERAASRFNPRAIA
ncbi:aminoacyl-tRNA hydrolase [bacterium]|nr:aminoacyl-tRNA hydrolase [bacterium]